MDVIRFTNPTNKSLMAQGTIVNGLKSKMWVERYADAGEFKFICPASAEMRAALPIGSFVTHANTSEIMTVENHEINDPGDGTRPQLTITGRGLETFLENRLVGFDTGYPDTYSNMAFTLGSNISSGQIAELINDHIDQAVLSDHGNALTYVHAVDMTGWTALNETPYFRAIKRGDTVYDALLKLLAVGATDLVTLKPYVFGIKVIRPNRPENPIGGGQYTVLGIHLGADKTKSVVFSTDTGEITTSDYLWSNKGYKNVAWVRGKWVEVLYPPTNPTITGFDRRVMHVDATDLDQQYATVPTGATLTTIESQMSDRGRTALQSQINVALTKAEVAKNAVNAQFRKDFDVGDLITVIGDYNVSTVARVSEYVEIEDETGENSYPTLTVQ